MPDTDLDSPEAAIREIVDGTGMAIENGDSPDSPEEPEALVEDESTSEPAHEIEPTSDESGDSSDTKLPTPTWKKLVAAGSWVVAVFFLFMVLANGSDAAREKGATGALLLPQNEVAVVPEDTLGIKFDEVRELWNTVEQPPSISAPLRRTPESGEFDSFFYGLDPKAEILGAYRDSDDYLVGLLVTARLDHEAISTLYLHVCHIVSPFSPDCLENYASNGLAGKTLAELSETGSETSWMFDGNNWRVTVSDRQLTIRVISPASG